MKPLDLSKPVQTRDGQPVTIFTTERPNSPYPVVGMTNEGTILTYTAQGKSYSDSREHALDLMNVPERRTIWLNIYENRPPREYSSRDQANFFADPGRIACVEVTYTEGEGL